MYIYSCGERTYGTFNRIAGYFLCVKKSMDYTYCFTGLQYFKARAVYRNTHTHTHKLIYDLTAAMHILYVDIFE